ncbi:MAG: RNA ligase [Candidatus Micrarchaeota archaeon]
MDASGLTEALKKGKLERLSCEIEYARFTDRFKGVERGTVIAGKRIIRAYPHIKRIFALSNGLARNMDRPFYAEEKIDGFNVRIVSLDGKIFAFSRGGFLDAFVTEKVRDAGFERYFAKNPAHVLCAEMIGNTPYTPPTDDYDVRLFVFDIDDGRGRLIPCAERYALLKEYGIEGVPVLGRFHQDDVKGVKRLMLGLNKGRKEGAVFKSDDRSKAVKYVTPWSDIEDISKSSEMLFDMPIGFYYQRILRSAFSITEFGLDRDEYAGALGKAFYDGLAKAINRAGSGQECVEEFEISIKDPSVWDELKRHMSREVRVEEIWRKRIGARLRIRFRKVFKKTSKTLISLANGKAVAD